MSQKPKTIKKFKRPRCHGQDMIKYGTRNNGRVQIFKCKRCGQRARADVAGV